MNMINDILLSGWFQITLIGIGLLLYSRAVIKRRLIKGSALGWMLGIFVIFVYASLNPPHPLILGDFDAELNALQVVVAATMGVFVSISMILISSVVGNSYRWQALQSAAITAILVIAIFLQIIAAAEIRLMVSLFVLAFAISSLASLILRRSKYAAITEQTDEPDYTNINEKTPQNESASYVGRIRQRIIERIKSNDVPIDHPVRPN